MKKKPSRGLLLGPRQPTLVYLIEVPALMQNLDSEDGDMGIFLLAVQNLSIESQNYNDSCHPGVLLYHLHLKETIIMKY